MQGTIRLLVKRPKIALIVSMVATAGFALLALQSSIDLQRYAGGPLPSSLQSAVASAQAGEVYVRLTDGELNCDQAVIDHENRMVYAPLQTTEGGLVGMVSIEGKTCELPQDGLQGVLKTPSDRLTERLRGALPDPALSLNLCTYCGAGNARAGLYVGVALMLAALGLYPSVLWARKKYRLE
jgi:hypothetical protein